MIGSGLIGLPTPRSSAALQLLNAGNVAEHAAPGKNDSVFHFIGSSKPIRSAAETIRAIVESLPAPSSERKFDGAYARMWATGLSDDYGWSDWVRDNSKVAYALSQSASADDFKRLASELKKHGTEVEFSFKGRNYGAEDAGILNASALQYAVENLTSTLMTYERAHELFAVSIKDAATAPDANAQRRAELAALEKGTLDLVAIENYGLHRNLKKRFTFSETGLMGTYSSNSFNSFEKMIKVTEKLMVKQDDGTFIDPESGRYVSYASVGSRGFFVFADRPDAVA